MKIFKELELLGFFEWLAEMHNLRDTDMKPEYLDELPLNDIHLTVCNSMAFRWFREKELYSMVYKNHDGFFYEVYGEGLQIINKEPFNTYEESELACIIKLIEIVKKQNLKG